MSEKPSRREVPPTAVTEAKREVQDAPAPLSSADNSAADPDPEQIPPEVNLTEESLQFWQNLMVEVVLVMVTLLICVGCGYFLIGLLFWWAFGDWTLPPG